MRWIWVVLLAGCSSRAEPSCGVAAISLDGKPLDLAKGFGYRSKDGDYTIVRVAAASKVTCAQVLDSLGDEQHLDVTTLSAGEGQSGAVGYYLRSEYATGFSIDPGLPGKCKGHCPKIKTRLDAAPKAPNDAMSICVSASVKIDENEGSAQHVLTIEGRLDATYCGEQLK